MMRRSREIVFVVSFLLGKEGRKQLISAIVRLFGLNMGSKRSAVILISYIYKNVKKEKKNERKIS